ncbi:MAG TPA: hypothetical protein VK909_07635 [Anaerolineales bacterium]|nr:hypothetical protein [Anaerolineales bacterium]
MNVGFAQSVITPSLKKPVFPAGFGTDRRAQTVHDDLYARAVAMQSDQTTMVLVALDLIGFMKTDVQEVIECMHKSHPQGQIVIASTHTHHGPDTMGTWGPDWNTCGVELKYIPGQTL